MQNMAHRITLLIAIIANSALLTHDYVNVENDSENLIAVGLYRTKSGHRELDFDRRTKTYEIIDRETGELKNVPLTDNIVYLLSPGQRVTIPNYPRKLGVDRDLWFSQFPIALLRTLSNAGRRADQWEDYKNVGSFVGQVYIGHGRPGGQDALEGFSSRKDAFSFPGTEGELQRAIERWQGAEVNEMLTVRQAISHPLLRGKSSMSIIREPR